MIDSVGGSQLTTPHCNNYRAAFLYESITATISTRYSYMGGKVKGKSSMVVSVAICCHQNHCYRHKVVVEKVRRLNIKVSEAVSKVVNIAVVLPTTSQQQGRSRRAWRPWTPPSS